LSASATAEHGTVDPVHVETVGLITVDRLHLVADLSLAHAVEQGGVVLAHPHPLYGGDRFNTVVDALFRHLPTVGFHTLRFDFRGVNDSEGVHGGGADERLDVSAAIDALAPLVGDRPLWLIGYSFGAMVTLAVDDPRVAGWIAIAPPLAMASSPLAAASDPRPTLVICPAHDQLTPPAVAAGIVADWAATELVEVPMADHSLLGRTAQVTEIVAERLTR
jgi:alpha/beta superfamily hydrolase